MLIWRTRSRPWQLAQLLAEALLCLLLAAATINRPVDPEKLRRLATLLEMSGWAIIVIAAIVCEVEDQRTHIPRERAPRGARRSRRALCVAAWLVLPALFFTACSIRPAGAADPLDTTPQRTTPEQSLPAGQGADASLAEDAARWQLSIDEYRRYLSAAAGLRGKISDPHITPIEVLGIEARTDAERRLYAERYVEMMWTDAGKVLAFSREVQDAWERLHPDAQTVSLERIDEWRRRHGSMRPPLDGRKSELNRLIVFTRIDACAACDAKVRAAIDQVEAGSASGADLYVIGIDPGHDDRVRAWARSVPVPPKLVEDGTITLNYDQGTMKKVMDRMHMTAAIPAVVAKTPQGVFATAPLASR